MHCRREAGSVEDLAFESKDARAEGYVAGFREVVGFWVVFRRGRCGRKGGLGEKVDVDVCNAA